MNEVINIVQRRTNAELTKGLNVTINGTKIEGAFLTLVNSGGIHPYKASFESNNVKVMIIAGISGATDPDEAGWYVYCNNREVLSADKSSLTTWRDDKDVNGIKYHNDFAKFRGFAFFTSSHPELLPWNTSKTGVDSSSAIYKEAKMHMINAFKVISSELRKLAGLDEDVRNIVAENICANSPTQIHYYTALTISNRTNIAFVDTYAQQARNTANSTPMSRISYSAETAIVDKIKKAFNISANRDVGIKTFEYFVQMEEIENA